MERAEHIGAAVLAFVAGVVSVCQFLLQSNHSVLTLISVGLVQIRYIPENALSQPHERYALVSVISLISVLLRK